MFMSKNRDIVQLESFAGLLISHYGRQPERTTYLISSNFFLFQKKVYICNSNYKRQSHLNTEHQIYGQLCSIRKKV